MPSCKRFIQSKSVLTAPVLMMAMLFGLPQSSAQRASSYDELQFVVSHHWFRPNLNRLQSTPNLSLGARSTPSSEYNACADDYARIMRSGKMEIWVGFGYMDSSGTENYVYNGTNYGRSAAVDMFGPQAFREVLTQRCSGNQQACGFRASGRDTLVKTIRGPDRNKVKVVVRLRHSSVSPYHAQNVGPLASRQAQQTQAAESFFFSGVKRADALLYIGHARNGGGPDFAPPRLLSNGQPNYAGYYQRSRPGLSKLVSYLRSGGQNPMVVGLFACLSDRHFARTLTSAAPNTGFVFTNSGSETGLIDYDELLKSGFATIDSLMRFQCRSGFMTNYNAVATQNPRIVMRNFLGR